MLISDSNSLIKLIKERKQRSNTEANITLREFLYPFLLHQKVLQIDILTYRNSSFWKEVITLS